MTMKNILKRLHWKEVMIAAISILITGFGISLWATTHQNTEVALVGIVTMASVCISWWFWVMVVIKTMIHHTDQTLEAMADINNKIVEIKDLVKAEIDSNR